MNSIFHESEEENNSDIEKDNKLALLSDNGKDNEDKFLDIDELIPKKLI